MSQPVSRQSFDGTSTSQRVIEAVAETTGNEPTDVEPLYHVVDPDALDCLFAATPGSTRADGRVQFTFGGCRVVVRGGDEVEVEVTEREAVGGVVDKGESATARVGSDYGNL